MIGREESRLLNVTVSSGAGSSNVDRIWAVCRRVRVIPPSEAATYTVTISDGGSDPIFKRTGQTGSLSEIQYLSLGICSSVAISSATADGTYKVKFDMH
jgi:hypothetical protein